MKFPWATPGQKVACIVSDMQHRDGVLDSGVVKGDVLTITAAEAATDVKCGVILQFAERDPLYWYAANAFRPVIDQSTDIAMFKAIAERGLAQNGIHVSSPQEEHA